MKLERRKAPKEILITCEAKDNVPLSTLTPLQGELAELSKKSHIKLWNSFIELGITFAFSIWEKGGKRYILDGHARYKVLTDFESSGVIVDAVPVVIVKADNLTQAKKKLLAGRSEYHKTLVAGLSEFIEDAPFDFEEIDDFTDLGIDLNDLTDDKEEPNEPQEPIGANKVLVEATYQGGLNETMDKIIKARMEAVGCKWYGEGLNIKTGQRDIAFELEVKDED